MATKKNTTITRNGKEYQYYRITRTIGYKMVDGEKVPIKKQFTGSSKANAEQKYQLWKESQTRRSSYELFGDLAEFYTTNILEVNSKYAKSTRMLYAGVFNKYLKDSWLVSMPMMSVRSSHIQRYYNELNITSAPFRTLRKFLKGFETWAYANGYSERFLDGVIIPDKTVISHNDDIVVWTDEELDAIMKASSKYQYRGVIYFAAYAGLRISEILGLKWENIKNGSIHVKEQLYRGEPSLPKGHKTRVVPIHPVIEKYLSECERSSEYVFVNKYGNPLEYRSTIRSIDRFYKRNGIPVKKFHAYRATFCTNLCKNGVPVQVASKLMGHSSIEVTAKYYTFIDADEMRRAVLQI